MTFKELGLVKELQDALDYMGFEKATPIQEEAIPKILEKKDLLACAQTGTGKTAAFILPVLHKLFTESTDNIDALVIAPTRELALQIEQQIQAFSYFVNVSSISVYGGGGGQDFEDQRKALEKGTDIIVATPGKLISHLNLGYVDFSKLQYLILDEADRMLDMGFFDDIQKIVSFTPNSRQTLLFSATFPPKIKKLGREILNDPDEITIAISKPAEGVLQVAYCAHDEQKNALIKSLIDNKPNYKSIIIFTSTKKKVTDIVRALNRSSYKVQAVSSDLDQKEREAALQGFRSRTTRVLVATDVLARGIDVKDINLVINYDVPGDAEDYVHRVGRTARADTTGVAITLINKDDMFKFAKIEKLIESTIPKPPLPPEVGIGPDWDPNSRGSRGYGGRGGGKGKGRSGGNSRSRGGKGNNRSNSANNRNNRK